MNEGIHNVLIDCDVLSFLKVTLFTEFQNPYKAASRRAYRDMNRTIRFNKLNSDLREEIRTKVDLMLEHAIVELNKNNYTQEQYDLWHYNILVKLCNEYSKYGIRITFGQAQKWVNMMMKYLYVLCPEIVVDNFDNFHIPIDNYIFRIAEKKLDIDCPKKPWSKWNSYEEYIGYQKQIRARIVKVSPLRWEFIEWTKEAKGV